MNEIKTRADLKRALHKAPVEVIQNCLFLIANEAVGGSSETLDGNKELGADFIGEVCTHLQAHGFWPTED